MGHQLLKNSRTFLHEELYIEVTTNHHEDIFSGVTSRGAALWRSLSSSKMKQVKYETSMKNIPLGGNKEYVMQLTKSVRKVVSVNVLVLAIMSSRHNL